jgi:signal recognition particle receptor subunit beta
MKIVVAGGFAVGKTTFVGAISEIDPLRTEAQMTVEGLGVDNVGAVAGKTGTTVAMDFGRITIGPDMVLYLFGTPGQDRFWFMWDELARGSIGGVVLVDTRRLEDCFPAVDYFEALGVPFVVACNLFDGVATHHPREQACASRPTCPWCCATPVASPTQETLILLVGRCVGPEKRSGAEAPPGQCNLVRGGTFPSGDARMPEERR